jgi:hypothetical protein
VHPLILAFVSIDEDAVRLVLASQAQLGAELSLTIDW